MSAILGPGENSSNVLCWILQEELSRLRQEMAEKERRKAAEMQARAMQERLAKSFTGAQTSTEQHQDSQANERTLKASIYPDIIELD